MGTEIHYCILCFKPLQIADARTGADEHYKKLIKCCEKFLPEEHTNELSKFCVGSPFPFCIVCYSSAQKLYRMNSQLESIYKNLEDCINTFSTEISCCRLLYISETQKIRDSNVSQNLNDIPALLTLKSHPTLEIEVKDEKHDAVEVDIEDSNGCFLDFESDHHPDETPEYEKKSSTIATSDLKPIAKFDCNQIFPDDVFPKQLRVTLKRLRFNSRGIIIESRHSSKKRKRTSAIRAMKSIRSQKSQLSEEFILGDFKRRKTTTNVLDDYWTDNNVSEAEFDILEESDSTDDENCNKTKSGNIRESSRYICCVCNEEFFNATELDTHSAGKNHENAKKVGCTRCSKTFYKIKDCKQHFRYHRLPNQACPVCGMVFAAYGSYRYHMSKHRNGSVNQCSICNIKWASMAALFVHMTTEHSDVEPVRCDKCDKVYYTEKVFNDHKAVCEWKEGDPPIKETDRFIVTQWTYGSLEEINVKLGPSAPLVRMEGGFKCGQCEMYFETSKDLETHSVDSGHATDKTAFCRYCKRNFYRLRDVYDHKRRCAAFIGLSTTKQIKNGEECWKVVSPSDVPPPPAQDVPQDNNNEIEPKLTPAMKRARLYFTCCVCDLIFSLAKQLDDHSEVTGHVNERKYCCPKCPKKYYRGKDLKDHRRKHRRELAKKQKEDQNNSVEYEGEKIDDEDSNRSTQSSDNCQIPPKFPLECSVCKCKFRLAMHLEAHSASTGHITERNIKCTYTECSRMFYRSTDMKIHLSEHSFQPTTCKTCGETFTKLTMYKKHLGKHQNDKLQNTIRCALCKLIWVTTKHLKEHMSTEHFNVVPLNCDKCEREYYTQEKFDQHLQLHLDCISKNIPFEEPDEEREWTWQNSDNYKCDLLPPSMEKRRKKGFACLVCGQYFELAKLLDLHSEIAGHVNEKTVTCETCARTFYRNRDLESHRRQSTRCEGLLLFNISSEQEPSSIPS